MKENGNASRNIVAYSMYMMQALDIIEFKSEKKTDKVMYRVSIKGNIKKYWSDLKGLLVEKSDVLMGLIDG